MAEHSIMLPVFPSAAFMQRRSVSDLPTEGAHIVRRIGSPHPSIAVLVRGPAGVRWFVCGGNVEGADSVRAEYEVGPRVACVATWKDSPRYEPISNRVVVPVAPQTFLPLEVVLPLRPGPYMVVGLNNEPQVAALLFKMGTVALVEDGERELSHLFDYGFGPMLKV